MSDLGPSVVSRREPSRLRWHLDLLPLWTRREIQVQYRQSALDLGWSLLTPVIILAGYGFVLTRTFGVTGDGIPYLTFAWSGLIVWTFIANALAKGAISLVVAADLVRKAAFPREVVPIATVLSGLLDLAIGLLALVVLMWIQDVSVSYHAIGLIPVLAVATIWTLACAVLVATLTAFVRDTAHGLGVILRIGIFVTPVMYPASQVPEQYQWAVTANPIAVFIEGVRDVLFRAQWPDWTLLGAHLLGAIALGLVAFAYLRRVEGRIADVI